ncbi:MAG: DNA-formamidopyrimidine glycosylase family protein [Vicinamibacterales bacterium]
MPEGDTIARAAARLHEALAGQGVTAFEAALARVRTAAENHPLRGRVVERVAAHGKHLVMQFSGDLLLRSHLRMHGSWHLYRPGERWQRARHAMRLRLETPEWQAVAFDVYDAELVAAPSARRLAAIAALGPDLVDPALDPGAAAARILASGARPIAAVLLDQRVVAGLGNVLRSEVLFLEGVAPDRAASTLPPEAVARLVARGARELRRNAAPTAARRLTTGRLSPDEALWVYQRTGRPCRRCGEPIRSGPDGPGGRRVYWCPRCQPA